jgi:hypothetical protein
LRKNDCRYFIETLEKRWAASSQVVGGSYKAWQNICDIPATAFCECSPMVSYLELSFD